MKESGLGFTKIRVYQPETDILANLSFLNLTSPAAGRTRKLLGAESAVCGLRVF